MCGGNGADVTVMGVGVWVWGSGCGGLGVGVWVWGSGYGYMEMSIPQCGRCTAIFLYVFQWEEFFDQIQPIATRLPYMVCIGNHERDFPNSG